MNIRAIICYALLAYTVGSSGQSQSQRWVLKNNLVYDATLTPNLGLEYVIGRKTSIQLFYGLHPWTFSDNKKIRHWSLMPEWRRWLSEEGPLEGWFWGLHLVGGEYNAGGKKLPFGLFKSLRDNRYEGWYGGGGLTIGHTWRLSCHWRLEAALGVGYLHTRYHQYGAEVCGEDFGTGHYNYVGPTKLALNIGYVFGNCPTEPLPVVLPPTPVPPAPYEPQYQLPFITPMAEAEKARSLSGRAFLDFVVNKTDIRPTYRGNAAELAKVQQTIDVVRQDPNTTITHISIHGYASPESPYQHNAYLANARAQAFKDYVQMLMTLPADIFSVASTPEDWDGLIAWLDEHADQGNMEAVRTIAKGTLAPDEKERQLKQKYPAEWRQLLADVFPALRHSDYEVSYTIRPFTVEEARELIRHKPQQLSLNEMFLVAQTYEPGSQDYNDVFLTAVRMYPDDETANLNAAIIALRSGDTAEAARRLQKAGSSPEALNAQGVLMARQGDTTRAADAFRRSGTPEAQHNLEEMNKQINSIY